MHDARVRHTHLVHCGRFDGISDSKEDINWLGVWWLDMRSPKSDAQSRMMTMRFERKM